MNHDLLLFLVIYAIATLCGFMMGRSFYQNRINQLRDMVQMMRQFGSRGPYHNSPVAAPWRRR